MKKSFITILCILTAFSLCLGGCGNDGSAGNISGTADTNISTDSESIQESSVSTGTVQPDGDRTVQSTADASYSSQNSGTHPVAGFYYMETPYYINRPDLIPIPQILLDYESWINSEDYRNSHAAPVAGRSAINDIDFNKTIYSKIKQFRIMACVQLTNEYAYDLAGYKDVYDNDYYDRKAYWVLADFWYDDDFKNNSHAYNGNQHLLFLTGLDQNGNRIIYEYFDREGRSYYTNDRDETRLNYPTYAVEWLNRSGLNLRNTNHMTH